MDTDAHGKRTRPMREASIDDLIELGERAAVVLEEARKEAVKPDSSKQLRAFTMAEALRLLDLHPTAYYELIRDNPEFQGNKVERQRLFSLREVHQLQEHLKQLPRQRYGITRALTLSVANFKGGVAKTFTAVTLAQYLAMRGYRVLVIDTDPQASLTSSFGIDPRSVSDWNTILPYLYGKEEVYRMGEGDQWPSSIRDTIKPTNWPGLDIICSNLSLYTGEFVLGMRREANKNSDLPFEFHRPLFDAIEEVRGDYDVILIDNPPSLSLGTTGAIYAAEGLIVPTPAENLDFESARAFMTLAAEIFKAVKTTFGDEKRLEIFRILITKFNGREAERKVAKRILEVFGDWCIGEPMITTASVQAAGSKWQTIYESDPRGKGRSVLKRAVDAADAVYGIIESDIIDVFESRQSQQADDRQAAA